MSRWKKLPPLETKPNPCANCPPILATAPLEKIIAVGFGSATVERDGVEVYREPVEDAFDDDEAFWDFNRAEQIAMQDPDHDWRAELYGADPVRVLVACEFSAVVRDAFRACGHDAVSCDLLPSERGEPHIQGDVRDTLDAGWDLMLAFPPCTHLAVSGARWFLEKRKEQWRALLFVAQLASAPIPRIAIENPIGILSSAWRKPDQIIQPWQFGHGETKATCLWLKNLPPLVPTQIVDGRAARVHREPPGPDRWKNRSRTLQGIADAMAEQWGAIIRTQRVA